MFYDQRCPEGGPHQITNGNCAKCGFVSSAKNKEFFEKYKENYLVAKAELEFKQEKSKLAPLPVAPRDYNDFFARWSFNYAAVLDLANKTKVNGKALSGLGAIEGVEYEDVTNAKYVPAEPKNKMATRIYVLDSYFKMLITEWNILRKYNQISRPSIGLKNALDEASIKRTEMPTNLESIYDEYEEKLTWWFKVRKPREIIDYIMSCIISRLLNMWDMGKVPQIFVSYFLKKILKAEEMNTKPGTVNWAALRAEEVETVDNNYRENEGLEDMPDNETLNDEDLSKFEDDDFGTTNTPLENNFDIEMMADDSEDTFDNDVPVELEGF